MWYFTMYLDNLPHHAEKIACLRMIVIDSSTDNPLQHVKDIPCNSNKEGNSTIIAVEGKRIGNKS